jgi:hypothetical protein
MATPHGNAATGDCELNGCAHSGILNISVNRKRIVVSLGQQPQQAT